MTYQIGDTVELVYTIADSATVALTITDPDGTTSTPTPTEAGTAPAVTYTADVAATKAGTWLYSFVATGAIVDAEDGQFHVQAPATAAVYTTLPEVKVALSLPVADTADDDDLQDAILAASRAVEGDCQRVFAQSTDTRTFVPRDLWRLRLGPYSDLVSVTTLKTDAAGDGTFETTWTAGDYQLLCADGTPNANAGPEPRPYREVRAVGTQTFPVPWPSAAQRTDRVQIIGVWGWPAVPDRIRRATRMAAVELFKLREAPLGAMGWADLGIVRVRENPKYQRLIADYRLLPVPVA